MPERARVALSHGRQNTLHSSHSVLVIRQNQLFEVDPDGSTQLSKSVIKAARLLT